MRHVNIQARMVALGGDIPRHENRVGQGGGNECRAPAVRELVTLVLRRHVRETAFDHLSGPVFRCCEIRGSILNWAANLTTRDH